MENEKKKKVLVSRQHQEGKISTGFTKLKRKMQMFWNMNVHDKDSMHFIAQWLLDSLY